MTGVAASSLALWLLLSVASLLTWLPARLRRPVRLGSTSAHVAVLVVLGAGTVGVAILAGLAPTVSEAWTWVGVGIAAAAALLTGGSVTTSILNLADSATQVSHTARVKPDVLRGGAWIGALERVAIVATLLLGWPEGIGAVIAVKGLARFPELRLASSSGAIERFIIGTFASLGWAAACAGVALLLVRP